MGSLKRKNSFLCVRNKFFKVLRLEKGEVKVLDSIGSPVTIGLIYRAHSLAIFPLDQSFRSRKKVANTRGIAMYQSIYLYTYQVSWLWGFAKMLHQWEKVNEQFLNVLALLWNLWYDLVCLLRCQVCLFLTPRRKLDLRIFCFFVRRHQQRFSNFFLWHRFL